MASRLIYYKIKPFIPIRLRSFLRRRIARWQRRHAGHIWPIKPGCGEPPAGWAGWPGGKRFAFVLTHDVEGAVGLGKVKRLAEMEMEHGVRSLFNFIPEGSYRATEEIRQWLVERGFEVGIHDLRHDGMLYRNRAIFRANAREINRYLKEWNAVGFRSGFMLHRLEWLHDLDILYDASTFDTDPFEPQPDGVDTIYPFVVEGPNGRNYVELPYTLPQDSTLFLLFQHEGIGEWRRKLDWIVEKGGMALVNVHPDYVDFTGGGNGLKLFSADRYEELLRYVRERYEGQFWQALPKEVAKHAKSDLAKEGAGGLAWPETGARKSGYSIWIDLDNTPHVPFFKPIIRELVRHGHEVQITAREAFQVSELADKCGVPNVRIGHHYGKNRFMKVWGIVYRAAQLLPYVRRHRPDLALSHGSRSQILLSKFLRIPSVLIMDYEFARHFPLSRPDWEIVPEAIYRNGAPEGHLEKVRFYEGIKEDVYAPELEPDDGLLGELNLDPGNILVTVRPPATEAHYHNPESEIFFEAFMERLHETPKAQGVLLPRNKRQEEQIRRASPHWFEEGKVIVPERVVDGMNLLWHSDFVVSGGGTMNREAAALGVPVYSIFRGRIGAVDRQLETEGRLVLVRSREDVEKKIRFARRDRNRELSGEGRPALGQIVKIVEELLGR